MEECEGKIVRLLGIREVEHRRTNSSHADLGSINGLYSQGAFALSPLNLYPQMFEQMGK